MNLTVITYNVQHFQHPETVSETIKKLMLEADIICLQECNHFGGVSKAQELIKYMIPGNWDVRFHYEPHHGRTHGFATLWNKQRLKFHTEEHLLLPEYIPISTSIHKMLGGILARRGVLLVTFETSFGLLRVSNIHLDLEGGLSHRMKQVASLGAHLKVSPADFEIVCGDFNTLGLKRTFEKRKEKIETSLGEQLIHVFDEFTPTHRSVASPEEGLPKLVFRLLHLIKHIGWEFHQHLDYILVTRNTTVLSSFCYDLPGSDHIPLGVTIQLKASI